MSSWPLHHSLCERSPSPSKLGEDLAGLACASLGWSPDQFWEATPAEVAGVVRALAGMRVGEAAAPVDGGLLARLREAFPDG